MVSELVWLTKDLSPSLCFRPALLLCAVRVARHLTLAPDLNATEVEEADST